MFTRMLSASSLEMGCSLGSARKTYSRLLAANLGKTSPDYRTTIPIDRLKIRLGRGFASENRPVEEIKQRVQEASSALPIDRQHQELIQSRLEELEANKPDLDKFALFNPETLAELPFFLDFLEPVVSQGKVGPRP